MRWWSSKSQSSISQVLYSAVYCYVILYRRPCYSSPCRSYHTGSYAHLGVPFLRPSISVYHTSLFIHLGISRPCPRIQTFRPATLPPSGSYCVTLPPNHLFLLASLEIPAKVARSHFSVPLGATKPPSCIHTPHLYRRPCYSSPCRSYHTGSYAHLGVPFLRPSISVYHTSLFIHLGISRPCPRIQTFRPATLPPSGSYCVTLPPNHLFLLASLEIPAKVARSHFSVASWCHQTSLLHPYPSYPFSPAQTSNIGRNATHCDTVAFYLPI